MNRDPKRRLEFDAIQLIHPPTQLGESIYVVMTSGEIASLTRVGAERWRRSAFSSRPPMTAQVSLAALGPDLVLSVDGVCSGIDVSDGHERWSCPFPADPFRSHFDGQFLWGYQGDTRSIRDPGTFRLLHPADGEVRDGPRRPRFGVAIATSEQLVLVREENRRYVAIDRAAGQERWSLALERRASSGRPGSSNPSNEVLQHGGTVIIPMVEFGFVAIDIDNGAITWERDLGMGGSGGVLVGDHLHFHSAWRWVELDASSGDLTSDVEVTGLEDRRTIGTAKQLAHHDGVLYGVNREGTVFGWSIAEHALVWTHPLGVRVEWACPPQVFLDALWIMDATGRLHVFELT